MIWSSESWGGLPVRYVVYAYLQLLNLASNSFAESTALGTTSLQYHPSSRWVLQKISCLARSAYHLPVTRQSVVGAAPNCALHTAAPLVVPASCRRSVATRTRHTAQTSPPCAPRCILHMPFSGPSVDGIHVFDLCYHLYVRVWAHIFLKLFDDVSLGLSLGLLAWTSAHC